jgi:plastocyanin
LTLAEVSRDGVARPVDAPPGPTTSFGTSATVAVRGSAFRPARLSLARGRTVTGRFGDGTDHDATSVAGPVGFGGPWSRKGDVFRRRFDVPGSYRLHCSLHPARMSQLIEVR